MFGSLVILTEGSQRLSISYHFREFLDKMINSSEEDKLVLLGPASLVSALLLRGRQLSCARQTWRYDDNQKTAPTTGGISFRFDPFLSYRPAGAVRADFAHIYGMPTAICGYDTAQAT